MKYSIVIPCYNSSQTIGEVVDLTRKELKNETIEFVLVNDGSPDGGMTRDAINKLADENEDVTAIDLAKNSGQHNAILCGLNSARGEYIICMDDDMQTHPSQLYKLINKLEEGYDVVYASYPKKKQTLFRRFGSNFNSWCEHVMLGKPKELETNSFWIMKRFVRDNLVDYRNSYTYLDGLVLRTTDNIANVEVEHFERKVGQSGYSFKKLVLHWFDIIGFTVVPLKAALVVGCVVAAIGLIMAVVILIKKLFFGVSIAGWSSMLVALCFFSGVTLMFMGFIGEYLGRVFMSCNKQPQYVIRSIRRKDDNI